MIQRLLLFVSLLMMGTSSIAQITDNFNDGDFTTNPTWSGDNSAFTVNPSFQLQLNGVAADTSSLAFPSPFATNCEWQFWVRLNFAPSDNNYVRLYLMSDVINLQGPVNGYYVRMGENGSFDSVDLWEQSGTTHTKIIDGINSRVSYSNNVVKVKITRSAAGVWNLYSDTTGGSNFVQEGTVTNNTFTTSNYCGVWCRYTISNINRFYFDDVYVGPIIVDTTPPTIVSSTALSATQLDVLFNEPVDLTTSQIPGNYSVNNSIGNPLTAVRDVSNPSLVHLTFANSFVSATNYTVTVNGVQDVAGNALVNGTSNFVWLPVVGAGYRDVIINEFMSDPSPVVGLPNTEFVELHNRTANNFSLSGWKLTDGSSTGTIPAYIIPAGGYVILCANSDTALFTPFGPTVGLSTFPSLNNSGDNIIIRDNNNITIDSITFDLSWFRDPVKDDGGWTLELINPQTGNGCAPAGNWIASVNAQGGTPGIQNSVFNNSPDVVGPIVQSAWALSNNSVQVCFNEGIDPAQLLTLSNYDVPGIGAPISLTYDTATLQCVTLTFGTTFTNATSYTINFNNLIDCAGNAAAPQSTTFAYYNFQAFDIVINEIMADPDPPVSLPNEEYFELHNTTAFPVRLDNWTITTGATTRTIPYCIIPADSFIIMTSTTAAPFFVGLNVCGVTSFSSLTNTGSTITIRKPDGTLMHSISYDDTWYNNSAKALGGWSLEQIDPNNPCGSAQNWSASNAPSGGTPGYRNSIRASNVDSQQPRVLRVTVITADSIGVWFSEPMDSLTLVSALTYSVDNSIGSPIEVRAISPTFSRIDLKLPSPIVSGITYTLTVGAVATDCFGNPIASPGTAPFALPEPVAPGDIVINELLADPNADGTDFIELYNRSNKVIDLRKVVVCTQDTVANVYQEIEVIAPEGFLLFPGEFVVLSEKTAEVTSQYNNVDPNRCIELNIPSMNVDGDVVVIADTAFNVVDRVVYSSEWHFPLLQTTKGVTLERIDYNRPTQDATNWHSAAESADFGTPTKVNSQYNASGSADDGAVTITNEVFSPDNDGFNDVVIINYLFSQPGFVATVTIYDSRGRLVRRLVNAELLGTEGGAFSWDGIMDDQTKARVGMYVIYFEAFNTAGEVKKYKRSCVLAGRL